MRVEFTRLERCTGLASVISLADVAHALIVTSRFLVLNINDYNSLGRIVDETDRQGFGRQEMVKLRGPQTYRRQNVQAQRRAGLGSGTAFSGRISPYSPPHIGMVLFYC